MVVGILSTIFGVGSCKKSDDTTSRINNKEIFITAQLNHLLMPIERGERYEDPLEKALIEHGYGRIDGGGTMQLKSGEIEYIDVEIILNNTTEGIPFVISQLEKFGAQKGSILRIHDSNPSREISFGKTEGIAIYLDGVNLPDEVYKTSDVNVVIAELNKRLNDHGSMHGYWQGPMETALYFYGGDAQEMKHLINDFINQYPLCKGARIVTIAPKSSEQKH